MQEVDTGHKMANETKAPTSEQFSHMTSSTQGKPTFTEDFEGVSGVLKQLRQLYPDDQSLSNLGSVNQEENSDKDISSLLASCINKEIAKAMPAEEKVNLAWTIGFTGCECFYG